MTECSVHNCENPAKHRWRFDFPNGRFHETEYCSDHGQARGEPNPNAEVVGGVDSPSRDYVRIQAIHPDWKDGECRECGKRLSDRVHKSVQRGTDVVETLCSDCNSAYEPGEFNTVVGGPSVPGIAVNRQGVTERL